MKSKKFIIASCGMIIIFLMSCAWSSQLISTINSAVNSTPGTPTSEAVSATPNSNSVSTEPSSTGVTNQITPTTSVVTSSGSGSQTLTNSGISGMQDALEAVYNKVNPSVVYIEVTEAATTVGGFGRFGNATPTPSYASGSGFVWDTSGDIVTNNHVVTGSTSIDVTFSNGITVPATIVGQDPNADLAVIKVNVPAADLTPIEVGDSTQVKVGQIAIAIGNPYGLQGSMSEGIISGLSRTLPVDTSSSSSSSGATYNIPEIIQTDAAINPGNSGGVLVDINGQLIGVTAAIESESGSNSGIGFVIPSAIVEKVVPSLISTGTYAHPWLGISGMDLSSDQATAMNLPATTQGALIIDVTTGGPADKAGLAASNQTTTIDGVEYPIGGDVIIAINDQTINNFDDLSSYLFFNTKPGDSVTLTVLRDGSQKKIDVTLGTLPNS